ncbi:MAG TPA: heavy-metal-associated domain-containing protein [Burkholderiales bacterium]|jgi:copper chaperone|nr:heavy-metal-associated domain-containing protein [Burkholderiales bacterium]
METAILKVSGMSCGGCASSVTNILKAMPGVATAEVSLQKGEAKVSFDPAVANIAQLRGAIENAGYEAR